MIIKKDEKRLLLAIKIIPIVLLSIVAIIGMIVALYLNEINFNNEIDKVKTEYLKNEKKLVKQEVIKIRNSIIEEQKLTEEKLKKSIQNYVYNAYTIVHNIYKANVGKKSKEEIIKMIKYTLREVRYNENRGYFFIYKMDGTALLIPPNKDLEGQNLLHIQDVKGNSSIKNMRDLVSSKGESFHTWWYKPNETKFQSKKIGFGKYYEPLDIFIGTGEYVEDFEEKIQENIIQRLSRYTYEKNYYLFIYDKDGKLIVHKNKENLGKLSYVYQGLKEKTLKESIASNTLKGEGKFYQYTFLKYNTKVEDPSNKISYLVKLKNWNWSIGSGFYTDDLNIIINETKEKLKLQHDKKIVNIFMFFVILMIIVIFLSMILSFTIKKRFESYKVKVKETNQLLFQQSKMASMGEMIENIAHQWRQPLSIISTTSTGLKMQQEFNLMTDKVLENGLNNISESVKYLSDTIDDFRNFYKDDKVKKSFNLSDTINKAIHLLHSRFRKKNIEVIIEDSDIEMMGLENEMIQVFMNILNNARDVLETLDVEKKYIFITIAQLDDKITISFYDNANGIERQNIPKLFDYKFTTKANQKGSGIGLYMSKLIVEKAGGMIYAQNKEYEYEGKNYKGAEFIISFKQ